MPDKWKLPSKEVGAKVIMPPTNEDRKEWRGRFYMIVRIDFYGGQVAYCNLHRRRRARWKILRADTEADGWFIKDTGKRACDQGAARMLVWEMEGVNIRG